MTKTKMSTVAIVVLSVLLAAALAATIVLAAFSFSRTASTTINFAGGVTLEATGVTGEGAWKSNTVDSTGKIGGEITAATVDNQVNGVALQGITLKNTGSKKAYVAVAVIITTDVQMSVTDIGSTQVTSTALVDSTQASANFCGVADATDDTTASTKVATIKSWKIFTIDAGDTANAVKIINSVYTAADLEGVAGKNIVANFYVTAAYTDAGLKEAIASNTFESFGASEVK